MKTLGIVLAVLEQGITNLSHLRRVRIARFFSNAPFLFRTRCLLLIAACAAAISLWRHLAVTQRAIRSNHASGRRGRDVYLPFFVPPFVSSCSSSLFLLSSSVDTGITELFLLYLSLQAISKGFFLWRWNC